MKKVYLSEKGVEHLSMIELAYHIVTTENRPMDFREIFEKISQYKQWDPAGQNKKFAQFYTDLNMDGRFVSNGTNTWGLKKWHRRDEINQDDFTVEMDLMIEEDDSLNDNIYDEPLYRQEE